MADDGSGPPDLVLPFVTFSGFFVSILEASVNSAPYNRIMTLTPLVVVFYTVAVFLSVSLTGLMVAGRISNTGDEYAALFTLLTATAWPAARQLTRAAAGRVRRSFAAIGGVPDGALPGCARYSDPIADDPAASVAAVGPEYWALASGVDEAGAGWLLVRIVAAAAGAREAPSEAEAYAAVAAVVGPDAWRAGRGHGGDRGRREGTEGGGSALVDTPPVAAATAKAAAMDTEAGVTPGEPYTPSCRELLLTFA
ncbi:hypothetical protein I4F81_005243 [Pyropia yezoensis]|uniref:Uncharacterized protein n=1 Tax=Pyropia yezoensis TaxID=2788 RepID=A0ACC3BXR1_PYRYE|nr:hypothetical protein I4F81_005243 [Neopyropia yezoensis]